MSNTIKMYKKVENLKQKLYNCNNIIEKHNDKGKNEIIKTNDIFTTYHTIYKLTKSAE